MKNLGAGLLALILLLSACRGYVMVKETPLPSPTITPTAAVRLITITPRATSTAAPATPQPTATATATATPVIHVVEKGDTLLEIADRYDMSVQAIIAVNQIENPQSLRIGQALIIPQGPAEDWQGQATPTPTPLPLRVMHEAFYRTPVGSLWCMGQVYNDRDVPLEQVQISVSLHNANGDLLDRGQTFIATHITPAQGAAPFAVLLSNPPTGGWASYQIVVLSAEPVHQWGRRHAGLVITQIDGQMQNELYQGKGTVQNQGDVAAEEISIIITALGANNAVVGIRQIDLPLPLETGASRSFEFGFVPAAPALRVQAVVQGMKQRN